MANSPWGRGNNTGRGGKSPQAGGGAGGGKPSGEFDFDQMLSKLQGLFDRLAGGAGGGDNGVDEKRLMLLLVGGLFVFWMASGIYRVNSDELGVVTRFGEYHRTTTPGLNYHLPYPIEQVIIPSVTSVNKVEIGDRTSADNPSVRQAKRSSKNDTPQNREGLMLTSDRNIVDIGFEVQWKIDAGAPEKFLFNLRDPAASIHMVAESAMREVIGRNNLSEILTTAQSKIAEDTRAIMQNVFDAYGAGIEVIAVNLSRPDVPQPVIDEFQDVKRAEQDKQTAESVAEGYRNEILPRARGDAAKMIQDAEAYKAQVVANAEGDAARFSKIYNEYRNAKDVTKKRMYLETMEDVLKGMPKMVVETGKGSVQVLPVTPPRNAASAAPQPVMPLPATTATTGAP